MTTWAAGEYPLMAERLEPVAVAAVDLAGVGAGDRVLDVATGTGNAALAAAARGATVAGVDVEPALLQLARRRRVAGPGRIAWAVGDAGALPVAAGSVDAVVSVFGCMYASDHDATAAELRRVVRTGGRVVLTSWVPGGVLPRMGALLAPYLPPPPPGSGAPSRWGDVDEVTALLARHGLLVSEAVHACLPLRAAGVADGAAFLVRTAGHVVAERERLEREGRWAAVHDDLAGLVAEQARADGDGLVVPLDHLLVVAEAR